MTIGISEIRLVFIPVRSMGERIVQSRVEKQSYLSVCGEETNRLEIGRELVGVLGLESKVAIEAVSSEYSSRNTLHRGLRRSG
jgi:hypothetical protein